MYGIRPTNPTTPAAAGEPVRLRATSGYAIPEMAVPTTETACPLQSSWKSRFARSGDVAVATRRSGEGRRQRQAGPDMHRGPHGDRGVAQVIEQLTGDDVRRAEVPDGPLLRLRGAQAPLAVAGGGVLQVPDDLQLEPGPESAQTLDAASELPGVAVSPCHPSPASSEGAWAGPDGSLGAHAPDLAALLLRSSVTSTPY